MRQAKLVASGHSISNTSGWKAREAKSMRATGSADGDQSCTGAVLGPALVELGSCWCSQPSQHENPAGCTTLLQLTQQMAVHRRVSGCSCDSCLLIPPKNRDPQQCPSDPLSPCQCSVPTCKHLFNHQGLGRSTGSLWSLQLSFTCVSLPQIKTPASSKIPKGPNPITGSPSYHSETLDLI